MKNKKGFLLAEETLKIIIAVICILFLAYFLVSLYLKSSGDEKLEMAKASLEHIVEEINAGNPTVEIYNPKGWVVVSWSYGVNGAVPKSCDNLGWKSCLCICDEELKTRTIQGLSDDCDKKGICSNMGQFNIDNYRGWYSQNLENSIKIEPPLTLKISGGKITT